MGTALEQPCDLHAADGLHREGIRTRDVRAYLAEVATAAPGEDCRGDHQQRKHEDDVQGQLCVDREEDDQDQDELEDVVEDSRYAGREELLDRLHIAGDPGRQDSDGIAVEEAHPLALDVAEHVQAETHADQATGLHRDDGAEAANGRTEDENGEGGQGVEGQGGRVAPRDRSVHGALDDLRNEQIGTGAEDHGQDAEGHESGPAADVREQSRERAPARPRRRRALRGSGDGGGAHASPSSSASRRCAA